MLSEAPKPKNDDSQPKNQSIKSVVLADAQSTMRSCTPMEILESRTGTTH